MSKVEIGNIRGKSAYEQAIAGGYTGSEEAFNQLLARAVNDTISTASVVGGDLIVTKLDGTTQNLGRVRGADGSNVIPTNQAIADAVTQDGPAKIALSATFVGVETAAAFGKIAHKIRRGVEDVVIFLDSDSTGNEPTEWARLWFGDFAALFPTHTFEYRLSDTTGDTGYGAAEVVRTGTGPRKVTFFNFAVPGSPTNYVLGARWAWAVQAISPDLIMISHGHNEGTSAANYDAKAWMARYLTLTESLAAAHPLASIVCILQNPQTANNDQALRARAYETVAGLRGYGVIDVHQAFLDTGNPSAYIKADGVHPTTAADAPAPNGSRLWANVVLSASRQSAKVAVSPQSPSTLQTNAPQLLDNGTFSDFTGPAPEGWTLGGATASKDTRDGFSRNQQGYGVRVQATGAAQSSLSRFISAYKALAGKWVTLTVGMRIPAGQAASAGRIALADGTQTVTSQNPATVRDGLFWQVVTMKVADVPSYLRAFLYADTGANAGADVTFDVAYLVEGVVPRIGSVGAKGAPGATGPASPTQVEHLSTISTNPLVTAALANAVATLNAANQGIFVPFKAQRDMLISILEWVAGTASGNYDIGLYSLSGTTLTRLWSKGSTAWPASGTDVIEPVSPAVPIIAGTTYYLVFSGDNATGAFRGFQGNQAHMRMLNGTYYAVIASNMFPLPAGAPLPAAYSQKVPGVVLRES